MLTLSLLRHAKSSWSDTNLRDFERPLNERGEKAAPRMGAFMAKRGLVPELVLCSPAVRARQTLDLVLPRLKAAPEVVLDDDLYLASPATLLKRIQRVPAEAGHVLVVGHNPGLHAFAQELAGAGGEKELEALDEKFPTAALAVIAFSETSWLEIAPGAGHLKVFMTPKRLP